MGKNKGKSQHNIENRVFTYSPEERLKYQKYKFFHHWNPISGDIDFLLDYKSKVLWRCHKIIAFARKFLSDVDESKAMRYFEGAMCLLFDVEKAGNYKDYDEIPLERIRPKSFKKYEVLALLAILFAWETVKARLYFNDYDSDYTSLAQSFLLPIADYGLKFAKPAKARIDNLNKEILETYKLLKKRYKDKRLTAKDIWNALPDINNIIEEKVEQTIYWTDEKKKSRSISFKTFKNRLTYLKKNKHIS